MFKAIITDIEGTTSDIEFVHQVLFPYAYDHLQDFVFENYKDPAVAECLLAARQAMGQPEARMQQVVDTLRQWIDEDRKVTALKTLQGLIWQQGYQARHFKGHVYPDAVVGLREWQAQGVALYVYSSGSVQAQRLLFKHSEAGDLSDLFTGFYDTQVGHKREPESYARILADIAVPGAQVLFLSDVAAELAAASAEGIQVCHLQRGAREESPYPVATDFHHIPWSHWD